ncbi:MAG: DUF5671 domain-containing protein [Candidatus Spechtbacterales bacterium]|nr:DUF5671 domain-containing protein [Candidatus Spechtbacterales bacterium]
MENTKQNKTNASHDGSVETGPRDVFLELLRMATLYMSAISVGTLLFQFINIYLPDALNNYRSVTRSGLRFSLAMLVIVFPVFVWVSRYIKKEIKEYPKKAELKIRKWLLSFTLFAAGLLIIGDLIALVNGYLQGELTGRFILKVLVVLLIAGAVFRYYLWQLKGERANKNKLMKLMEQIIIGLVGIILVAGFVVAGSPQEERLRRFDERRINDLNSIQWQVVNFWQQKDRLPN